MNLTNYKIYKLINKFFELMKYIILNNNDNSILLLILKISFYLKNIYFHILYINEFLES